MTDQMSIGILTLLIFCRCCIRALSIAVRFNERIMDNTELFSKKLPDIFFCFYPANSIIALVFIHRLLRLIP
jgi:hypothetical protein